MSQESKEQVRAVLSSLNLLEKDVLSRVLTLENEYLYLKQPRVKDDILRILREVVK